MERVKRHSIKLAVWAIKTCLGAEKSRRLHQWLVCIYHRISFPLLYPAEFKLTKIQFDILFFSDNPHRWQNIKLVVEELRHRRPDLRLGLAFSDSREREELTASFNLEGISIIAHITIGTLYLFDTRILYTSATDLPPSMVPPKARVVRALISMLAVDIFNDYQFDADDYILCAGVHHVDSFRKLALRRPALLGKRLIPAGYPKLDLVLASCSTKRRPTDPLVRSTVIYAPTHARALGHHDEAIINVLIAEGHRVIFRPHPASFNDQDRPVIDWICQLHAGNPKFSLDASNDYTQSYSLADLMVTDLSGTGFTFSFSFGRPCIFFSPNTEAEHKLSLILFDSPHRIGALVRNIDEMIEKISKLCNRDMTNEIERFRDETVFNVGKSAAYIVDCLEDILSGSERPEWVRL
jgi:hypothetical protein